MRTLKSAAMISALTASVALFPTGPVSAVPLSPAAGGTVLAVQLDQALPTVQVRNGGAVAAGVIGGMILGGIIASQAPRYYGYPYGYPVYGYPAYQPYAAGDAGVAYCMRRFRSYDPYSMTYVGRDGFRHPCP